MSGKNWMKLSLIALLLALALPMSAAAETCYCNSPVFYLEDTESGSSCSALGNQLVYNLNTASDADCVSRGYSRSCADEITLHSCTLSGGQVHRYGFIGYSCAYCMPDPDQPQWP